VTLSQDSATVSEGTGPVHMAPTALACLARYSSTLNRETKRAPLWFKGSVFRMNDFISPRANKTYSKDRLEPARLAASGTVSQSPSVLA